MKPSVVAERPRAGRAVGGLHVLRRCSDCSARSACEEHDRGIDALLVSPISRESIYLGKAIGNLIFLVRHSGHRHPGAGAVLQSAGWTPLFIVSGIVFLAMVGIVAVGTLFSAMAVNTRLAELLLADAQPSVLRAGLDECRAGGGADLRRPAGRGGHGRG